MARVALKPLSKQTIVLTAAHPVIGLVTARMLAERGAKLFLIARSEDALRAVRDEIRAGGWSSRYAVTDVADNPRWKPRQLEPLQLSAALTPGSMTQVPSFTAGSIP